jgi:hypothetical protein
MRASPSLPLLLVVSLLSRAAAQDAVAGGSGYAMSFDSLEGQTVALAWAPTTTVSALTVEYWVNILDTHLSQQPVFAYSVYSVAGRYGQGGAPCASSRGLAPRRTLHPPGIVADLIRRLALR